MIANPFTYGNPISNPVRFFGREREVEQVYTRLRNTEFESSSIVGERRIGKTSLLNYMAHPDVARRHGLDPQQFLFVYLDLQMVGPSTTPTRLWGRLLRQMKRRFVDAELQEMAEETRQAEVIDTFALADLFDVVDEKELYVVLLLDEFENVTNNPNFGTDFFYGLRSLAIHHNLALVTSSRQELIELCHSEAVRASPFFNIFANINLRVFTPQEARKLIDESLAGTGTAFQESEIEHVFRIAGYHPYFLQAACHFLFEAHRQRLRPAERLSFAVNEFEEEATPHFAHYWHDSDDTEKVVLAVLAMLEKVRTPKGRVYAVERLKALSSRSDLTMATLEKRGLTVHEEPYRLFSIAFADWIMAEATDTASDDQTYEEWLNENGAILDRVGWRTQSTVGELLPQIKGEYRRLLVNWFSDRRIAQEAAQLLLDALEHYQRERARKRKERLMARPTVFISYSHKDEEEKEQLLSHLGVLRDAGLIDLWSDDRIGAGADWEAEIRQAIDRAEVAILLVSANFLTSGFILRKEVPELLKRRDSEGLTIFPVIAKPCAWKRVDWLAKMNARPRNGRPVWRAAGIHADEDLAAIAEEVANIVER